MRLRLIHFIQKGCLCLLTTILLFGCRFPNQSVSGVTFITSRGNNPAVQSVIWSLTDNETLLLRAEETPELPFQIYILNTKTKVKKLIVEERPAFFHDAQWMPDGKRVLILSASDEAGQGSYSTGWWLIDIDTGSRQYFMKYGDIAFSPDGKTVAALREIKTEENTARVDLFLIDIGTKEEKLVHSDLDADHSWGISWSPDGKYAVFALGQKRDSNLFLMNIETKEVTKLTDNNRSKYPVWSPKGNIIAYVRSTSDNIAETYLYLTTPDGKCDLKIPNIQNVWSPTWSPDGEKLGFVGVDGVYYLEVNKVFGRDIYQDLCQ